MVTPSGSKLWRFCYIFAAKESMISIGPYPAIKLADARDRRFELQCTLLSGAAPAQMKRDKVSALADQENSKFPLISVEPQLWPCRKRSCFLIAYAYIFCNHHRRSDGSRDSHCVAVPTSVGPTLFWHLLGKLPDLKETPHFGSFLCLPSSPRWRGSSASARDI